jgi:predicted metal-binding membrane protein
MTSARSPATAAALTATLGLAAASWVVAVRQMNGMDMGVATRLGSFAFFVALWVAMMAAMMLPGAAPAVLRRAHASGRLRAMPLFVGSYLAVWTLVGVAVYALYRPHGSSAAGAVAIVAGVYEFTPLKQHFRRRCRQSVRSGFQFGLYCVGSSIGLMLMLVALGVMSVTWMAVIAVLVLAQKLLPARAAIESTRSTASRPSPGPRRCAGSAVLSLEQLVCPIIAACGRPRAQRAGPEERM